MADQLRVSATLYTTWRKCPAQAAARLDGHYPTDTIAAFKGLLAHRLFARHLTSGPITPAGFQQASREEIGSSHLNWKVKELSLKPSQVNQAISEIADLYRRFTTINPAGQPEVHVEYQLTEKVTLIGTIDCVEGPAQHPRLVDWKTGEVGDAISQLRFYAAVWTLSGRPMPVSVTALSVLTGERVEEWTTREMVNETAGSIVECVADLTTGGSVAMPGPWCRWCPILTECGPGSKTMELVGGG